VALNLRRLPWIFEDQIGPNEVKRALQMESAGSAHNDRRRAILVLGMHRSGTSALTRLLGLLGAALPATLVAADENNETGYWESLPINQALERLLREAGSAWQDWRPFDPGWHRTPAAAANVAELKQVILSEFGQEPLFVLKDPRICRLIPLFSDVLHELNIDPSAVIIVRHPTEVVESLRKRNQLSPQHARLLWLRHVLDAERNTRSWPRAFVTYAQLLEDWSAVASATAQRLGLEWRDKMELLRPQIDAMLSKRYRHHFADAVDLDTSDIPCRTSAAPM
jgi:hypothetical protein